MLSLLQLLECKIQGEEEVMQAMIEAMKELKKFWREVNIAGIEEGKYIKKPSTKNFEVGNLHRLEERNKQVHDLHWEMRKSSRRII